MKRTAVMGLLIWTFAVILPGCGPSTNDLVTLGVSQYQVGKLEQAKATFTRVLRADPSNARALYYMGRTYYSQGAYEMAVYRFQCAIDADPSFRPDPGLPSAQQALKDAQRRAGTVGAGLRFIPDVKKEP